MDWLNKLFNKDSMVEVHEGQVVVEGTAGPAGGSAASSPPGSPGQQASAASSTTVAPDGSAEASPAVRITFTIDLAAAKDLAKANETIAELVAKDAEWDAKVQQLEEEWSGKMGEYMQRNAQLRVDAKQATRRATAAEKELAAAQERIASLEQGLEDAALEGDERLDSIVDAGTPVANLGAGHGGVDLTSPALSQLALSSPAAALEAATNSARSPGATLKELDADDLLVGGRDDAEAEVAEALAAEEAVVKQSFTPAPVVPPRGPSPSRLPNPNYEDEEVQALRKKIAALEEAAAKAPPPGSGGCCIVS